MSNSSISHPAWGFSFFATREYIRKQMALNLARILDISSKQTECGNAVIIRKFEVPEFWIFQATDLLCGRQEITL